MLIKSIPQVFSFVFGDGDPNDGLEEKRWKMVFPFTFEKKCRFFYLKLARPSIINSLLLLQISNGSLNIS